MSFPVEPEYLSPLTDIAFKRLFGDAKCLVALLNAILPEDVQVKDLVSVEHLVPKSAPCTPVTSRPAQTRPRPLSTSDQVRYDILAVTKSNQTINIEVQRNSQKIFNQRLLYYGARLITKTQGWTGTQMEKLPFDEEHQAQNPQMKKVKRSVGKWQYKLYPVFVIAICDFPLRHIEELPGELDTRHMLWASLAYNPDMCEPRMPSGEFVPFTKSFQICMLSCEAFRDNEKLNKNPQTPLQKLLWILSSIRDETTMPESVRQDQELKCIIEKLRLLSCSPEVRKIHQDEVDALNDRNDEFETKYALGVENGVEIGDRNARREFARTLHGLGHPVGFIATAVRLPEDEVEKLLKEDD
ncbi:PD-XK nuclease family transposase-domain-containing protein [Phlyctochytrium arcticum]|nr:PD-XK nuclease family transposase-domain-containing protein [Phlyctochytrium arcticum]